MVVRNRGHGREESYYPEILFKGAEKLNFYNQDSLSENR
jgi:hypothetical protein